MKLSQTAVLAMAASAVVIEAAPAPIAAKEKVTAITKRDDLEKALAQFVELQNMRAKRDEISTELSAREYAIVTEVLTAIKDTDLAPVVLKFFVKNSTLSNIASEGVVMIVKSGKLSAETLLSLLVQSGLITSVLNDVLGDCEVYASIISIAESLIKKILKREVIPEGNDYISPEEGMELLRRDGLITPSVFDDVDIRSLETRSVDDVIINILESLAESGLASQVVETVLTDSTFLSFGAKLIETLYADGLISLGSLVSAVEQSGLLSQLLKTLLNFSTLEKIASTAIAAATGKCSANTTSATSSSSSSSSSYGSLLSSFLGGSGSNSTTKATATSTSATSTSTSKSSSLLGVASSLLGGSSILSGVSGLLDNFFGDGKSKTTATTTATTAAEATPASVANYACSTSSSSSSLWKKRRLY